MTKVTLGSKVEWEFTTCSWRLLTIKHYKSTSCEQHDVWFFAIGKWCAIRGREVAMVEDEL